MKLSLIIKAFLLSLVVFGCGSSDVNPANTFQIYLDYWNTTGRNPEIRFDENKTSKEIKIDFTKTFEGRTEGNYLTNVIIDNFKIVDAQNNNYNIESIKAYEYSTESNNWREDVEFTMEYKSSQEVGVIVLVLDRSNSLGEDFQKIQQYARDFVDQTFNTHPGVSMGIVDFSTDVKSFPISNDKEALKNYISNMQTDRFTALYQAIDEGIDMLSRHPSESKIMVTFTDGRDNQSDANYYNINSILAKLKNDKNAAKIRNFFIGLEGKGGLENGLTDKLKSNGWITSTPQNAAQVKEVFEKFGKLISNVYHLTYIRNQQVIPRSNQVKLKFEITASK